MRKMTPKRSIQPLKLHPIAPLQPLRHAREQPVIEERARLRLRAVADREQLRVLQDVVAAEPGVEKRVGGGEDNVAEAVLLGEDEHGVEEALHGRCGANRCGVAEKVW